MSSRTLFCAFLMCLLLAGCKSAEESAQAYFERGLELLEEGDPTRARLEFRNALKEVDTMIEPRLRLARLDRQEGAVRSAQRHYQRIAEQDPLNLEAKIALGEIGFKTKNWDLFEQFSREAVTQAPDNPAVRVLDVAARYRTAALEGDSPALREVLTDAEALLSDTPDNPILRQLLINGYAREKRFAEALAQIDKAIEAEPRSFQNYDLKLQILAETGELDALEQELRRILEIFPKQERVRATLLELLVFRDRIDQAEALLRDQVAAAPIADTDATVALIRFLLQFDTPEAAMEELEGAIRSKPDAHALRTLQASLRFEFGSRDEAIAELQELVDGMSAEETAISSEDLENAKVALAAMLAENGNQVGARRLVEEVLATNPDVVPALKMRARWMIEDDRSDEAINTMRLVLAREKQDFEAMTIMAEAYQRAGKRELMMEFLSLAAEASNYASEQSLRYARALRAQDKPDQAEDVLIRSLRMQPDTIDVLAALGEIYVDLEEFSRARQVIETLKKTEEKQAQSIASGLELTLMAREHGNDQVMAYLESLADDQNGGQEARVALIKANMQMGEYDKALALIDELKRDDPGNFALEYLRGFAQAALGEYDAAERIFADLVQRYPNVEAGWLELARLRSTRNQPEAVLRTLDQSLAENPDSPNLLWAKASYLQQQADTEGAIAIYEELYDRNSGSLIIANNLASLLATFRDDEESLERARVISRRLTGTDVPAFQDTYGWILFRSGETEAALEYLEPAAKGLPRDASVQFHLGEVYNALGRKREALEQMRTAMEQIGPLATGALSAQIATRIEEIENSLGAGQEEPGEN